MAFMNKLGGLARNIGDKASDAIETTKLNNKIGAEKNAITKCMGQIGEYYYAKHQAGELDDPGVEELFAAIDGHYKTIEDTNAEIARIKAENTVQAPAAPAAPAPAGGGIVCPSCEKTNAQGTRFCCECGSKLEVPPPPANRACPDCGVEVPAASRFCGECGYRFE